MYAYQGGLYRSKSLIVGGKEVSGIWRIDAENIEKEAELVLPITDQWQLNSVNVVRGYSQLSYYDGMLYYNTPRAVWRWNFDPESEPEKYLNWIRVFRAKYGMQRLQTEDLLRDRRL